MDHEESRAVIENVYPESLPVVFSDKSTPEAKGPVAALIDKHRLIQFINRLLRRRERLNFISELLTWHIRIKMKQQPLRDADQHPLNTNGIKRDDGAN